jgi:hypothetical protein
VAFRVLLPKHHADNTFTIQWLVSSRIPSMAPSGSGIPRRYPLHHAAIDSHRVLVLATHAVSERFWTRRGAALSMVSPLLDATIMLLPGGVALGCAGTGVIAAWGLTGDVFDENKGVMAVTSPEPQAPRGSGAPGAAAG